jgi:hypothetical protein
MEWRRNEMETALVYEFGDLLQVLREVLRQLSVGCRVYLDDVSLKKTKRPRRFPKAPRPC